MNISTNHQRMLENTMWPPQHSLVSGASSGIGQAMALVLSASGNRLTLLGRDVARLEDVAQTCREQGSEVSTAALDVCDRGAMRRTILQSDARYPLDLVIANAGISGASDGDRRQIVQTNIEGVLNTVEPIVVPMEARGQGRIAIMASLAGFKSFPNAPLYCASKAAVRSYGEAMAARLQPKGISVSVLCPGFVETPLTATNPFAMPLMMSPDLAAARLLRGIEQRRVRVAFPRRLYALTRFLELLPSGMSRWLLAKLAANQGLKE